MLGGGFGREKSQRAPGKQHVGTNLGNKPELETRLGTVLGGIRRDTRYPSELR